MDEPENPAGVTFPEARTSGEGSVFMTARKPLCSFVVAAALLLAACGNNPDGAAAPDATPARADFPVTIDSVSGPVEVQARPERIVSLSPTSTEMLFAIGAGDQVVAVDDQSDYPPEAPTTDLSGYQPNIEAIAAYEPDLVVMDAAAPPLQRSFKKLQVPLLQLPAPQDIEGSYDQIAGLGLATGRLIEAEKLVSEMTADIEEIVSSIPEDRTDLSYYHELDDTYFTVTSGTFIGQIYALVGLENIADEAKGAGTGYPQLSAEYIIDTDPDLIFLADTECCEQSAATVAQRPGWNQITAVENDAVVELSDDVASRWGPRVVDLLRIVVDAVRDLEG